MVKNFGLTTLVGSSRPILFLVKSHTEISREVKLFSKRILGFLMILRIALLPLPIIVRRLHTEPHRRVRSGNGRSKFDWLIQDVTGASPLITCAILSDERPKLEANCSLPRFRASSAEVKIRPGCGGSNISDIRILRIVKAACLLRLLEESFQNFRASEHICRSRIQEISQGLICFALKLLFGKSDTKLCCCVLQAVLRFMESNIRSFSCASLSHKAGKTLLASLLTCLILLPG